MAKSPNLDGAYDLKSTDDHRRLYAQWAQTYDARFADAHGFMLPQITAAAFASAGGRGPVLDIGAGTGLAGEALARLDISPIDAFDLSPEMLDVAREKAVYRNHIVGDILRRNDHIGDKTYEGVISSGTFTLGHVGPEALPEILRITAYGGLVTIAINEQHFKAAEFADAFDALRGQIMGLTLAQTRIYAEGSDGDHANDTALIAQFIAC